MTNTTLQLIKSEKFGEVQADIYSNDTDMLMTANQLCDCLQEKRATFDSWVNRNPYLKSEEFSVSCKLQGTDGKAYNTRLFNEDGIYEVTFLSKTEVAKKFRAWVRGILKSLRKGDIQLSANNISLVPEVLANKIDQLIGYNEQLAKSISTIKSEIFKISYKPTYSSWKTIVNSKILEISKTTEIPCTTLQNQIFLQMKENGCDLIKLSNQYAFEKGIEHCPIIEYIDKTESIKIQFDILLDEMIEKTANNPYYQHNDVESIPTHTTQSVAESLNRPVTATELIRVVMQPLIEKFDDHSSGGCATYRKVYKAMGVSWKYRTTAYMNEYGLKTAPKKMEMIVNDRKLRLLFGDTIQKLLQEN